MNKLSQYLKREKILQEDFARRIGSSQPVVSKMCRGHTNPSPELAKKVEDETGGEVPFYVWPAYQHFAPRDGNAA